MTHPIAIIAPETLSTRDTWFAAYLVTRGVTMTRMSAEGSGVRFHFQCEDGDQLLLDWINGASVSGRAYAEVYMRLRESVSSKLESPRRTSTPTT